MIPIARNHADLHGEIAVLIFSINMIAHMLMLVLINEGAKTSTALRMLDNVIDVVLSVFGH